MLKNSLNFTHVSDLVKRYIFYWFHIERIGNGSIALPMIVLQNY